MEKVKKKKKNKKEKSKKTFEKKPEENAPLGSKKSEFLGNPGEGDSLGAPKNTKEEKEKLLEIEKEEEKKKGEEEIKKGDEKEEPKIEIPASAPFIDFIFNEFLADRFGEVWILKPKELVGLSKATDDMVLHYAEWLAKFGVQFNFGFWLFVILSPRWQSLKKPRKSVEPEKKDIGKEK